VTLSAVLWKWKSPGYRTEFTAEHVNTMAAMLRRNYSAPLRVLCVTNDAEGIDGDVEIVADREDFKDVPNPSGRGGLPSCFRRLRMFEPDATKIFGELFVSIDLDAVVVRDLTPLWERDEDFVGWRDPMYPHQLNGSMMLLRGGSKPEVWWDFDPASSPQKAAKVGYRGSDQGYISWRLPKSPQWRRSDGVCSYRMHANGPNVPDGARIVFFHGEIKPWALNGVGWICEHYRR